MKKINICVFAVIFVLSLVGSLKVALATTPVFQTEEEIDAYYDAQKLQNKKDFEQQVEEINKQLQINLDKNHEYFEAEKLEAQRKIFGENFEIIKPFLPESNPDPEAIYLDLLEKPTQNGVSRIKMLMLYNPELAEEVHLIIQKKSAIAKLKLIEINKEICISDYGTKSEWNGVYNENGEVYCRCLKGYVMGENKKCVPAPEKTSIEKSTTNNVTKDNESIKDSVVEKEIVKPEPVKKVPWYKKFINWLF